MWRFWKTGGEARPALDPKALHAIAIEAAAASRVGDVAGARLLADDLVGRAERDIVKEARMGRTRLVIRGGWPWESPLRFPEICDGIVAHFLALGFEARVSHVSSCGPHIVVKW